MKQFLLGLAALLCTVGLTAQTTILDFEDPATSTMFQYFGSSLDGTAVGPIANPDMSGINTSAMVMEHVRPAGALLFAGAFSNPNPSTPIDLTTDNQICMDVWMPAAGNVRLKLEQATDGSGTWETQLDVDQGMTWTQLCFSANAPDINNGNTATGKTYERMVIFFDFGLENAAEATTYYFDNVETSMAALPNVSVTFAVDMSEFTGTISTVDVAVNTDPTYPCTTMTDDDGDGIYTATVMDIPQGELRYLFAIGCGAGGVESLEASDVCAVSEPALGGLFVRRANIMGETTFDPVCYSSCYGCGDGVDITIELGTAGIDVADSGIFIAGGGNFGNPGDFQLTDDDMDGIYTLTIEREEGFSSFFTFTNGNCPDYSCKENIAGQACANPDNFNDRFFGPVTQDTIISTCFAECTTSANDCTVVTDEVMITFEIGTNALDMVSPDGIFVAGGEFGAPGTSPLTDDDGDGIYTGTFTLPAGITSFYTLTNGNCPDYSCKENIAGQACANPDNFNDRIFVNVTQDTTISTCFGECTDMADNCTVIEPTSVTFEFDASQVADPVTSGLLAGNFNGWSAQPMDDIGNGRYRLTLMLDPGQYEYKFVINDGQFEEFPNNDGDCTIENGGFINRVIEVTDESMSVCFVYGTCDTCEPTSTDDLTVDENLFQLAPTATSDFTTLSFGDYSEAKTVRLYSTNGQLLSETRLGANAANHNLDLSNAAPGMYFVSVQTATAIATKRVVRR